MEETLLCPAPPTKRRFLWAFLKWGLFAVVIVYVGERAVQLWRDSPRTKLHVDIRWLIPAAVMYLAGWLPSIWFWRAMLKRMHRRVGWYEAIRAYYVGHVGKYLPGKALTLVLRGTLLKDAGINPVFGGVTAAYETLIFMWSGAALALALAPLAMPDAVWQRTPAMLQNLRQQAWLLPVIVLIVTVSITPFSAWLFTLVGRKALPRNTSALQAPAFTASLMVQGAFITSLGWLCHAISLGCILQAISNQPFNPGLFDLHQFVIWLASICISTVGGFVILVAPGGLGIREWLLVEMLKDQPGIGPTHAVVAAGLMRAVSFISELAAAGVLYAIKPRPATQKSSATSSK